MPRLPDAQVTPRLLLRPWRPDDEGDVDAAYEIYRHSEVSRWLGSRPSPPRGRDEVHGRLVRWADRADGTLGVFAVVPFGGPDRPLGTALLLDLPASDGGGEDGAYEIGWHLHPSVWGRGYGREAGAAMALRARAGGMPEVRAVVYAGNTPSLAVCDQLGMTRLGLTDRWYGVDLVDHVLDLRDPL
ncbi:MAG: GNAT family N-acetyltransferase [Candidatus Nanopelagicales bacterium]